MRGFVLSSIRPVISKGILISGGVETTTLTTVLWFDGANVLNIVCRNRILPALADIKMSGRAVRHQCCTMGSQRNPCVL